MLPTVDFCGLTLTRLLIGANPFGGFSHQNPARDQEMRSWHTPERIIETWNRAAAAGINAFVSNNETPHVIQTVETYLKAGAPLQWVAQLSNRCAPSMQAAVDRAIEIGAKAAFFHGGIVDNLYAQRDDATLRAWVEHAKAKGIPIGVAGHAPETHYWVDSLNLVDFHVVWSASVHRREGVHEPQRRRRRHAAIIPARRRRACGPAGPQCAGAGGARRRCTMATFSSTMSSLSPRCMPTLTTSPGLMLLKANSKAMAGSSRPAPMIL